MAREFFSVSVFDTRFGRGWVCATDAGVFRVMLPGTAGPLPVMPDLDGPGRIAAAQLESYFKGTCRDFDIVLDLSGIPGFRRRVLEAARSIPYGETRTYAELSVMAGAPKGARAAGGAMASNPVPVIVPCHRVVASSGALTGFSAPGGILMKKQLLEMEGVVFRGDRICH